MINRNGKIKVAVVGAGIAGLVAGYELKRAGFKVEVFEQSKRPGGRMKTEFINGLAFDGGADFFSQNYVTLKAYAKEFGITWLPTQKNSRHRVIRGGKPYYLNFASLGDLARFKLLSPWSRVRFGFWLTRLLLSRQKFDLFDLSTIPNHYDFDNAAHYISQVASQETADYIVDSFTSIMQFHRAKEISTSALFALMQTMTDKKTRFALCSTPEGIDQIPRALAKQLHVCYETTVESLVTGQNGVAVKVKGKTPEIFEAAVMAVPAPTARLILTSAKAKARQFLESVRYATTLTVTFRVLVDLFLDRTHLSYVPYVESKLIGGYANEGAKLGARCRNGKTLINVYLQEESARNMLTWPDQKIFATVFAELKKLCPEVAESKAVYPLAIARWPLAMPKFNHRYVSSVKEFIQAYQGKNGLYFAGDFLNSPWTEGAARSGARAAQAIIKDFSSRF